jgi:hypothetical protein
MYIMNFKLNFCRNKAIKYVEEQSNTMYEGT